MQDGYVNLNSTGGVATVTFHHPKSNSLPGHVLRSMATAIIEAGQDNATRVIVLRSDGDKAFCAGASFDELLSIDNLDKGTAFFSGFAGVINAIRTSPCFVIGRIHGKAVGGGVGLVAACDASYAHSSSAARLSELAIGIALALPLGMVMGWGLVHLLVELLKNDQFLFPVVISARTYAVAGLCVVAAGLASALVVRRQIDRLDMVGALKTRE